MNIVNKKKSISRVLPTFKNAERTCITKVTKQKYIPQYGTQFVAPKCNLNDKKDRIHKGFCLSIFVNFRDPFSAVMPASQHHQFQLKGQCLDLAILIISAFCKI